jgi:hypothetical protein
MADADVSGAEALPLADARWSPVPFLAPTPPQSFSAGSAAVMSAPGGMSRSEVMPTVAPEPVALPPADGRPARSWQSAAVMPSLQASHDAGGARAHADARGPAALATPQVASSQTLTEQEEPQEAMGAEEDYLAEFEAFLQSGSVRIASDTGL